MSHSCFFSILLRPAYSETFPYFFCYLKSGSQSNIRIHNPGFISQPFYLNFYIARIYASLSDYVFVVIVYQQKYSYIDLCITQNFANYLIQKSVTLHAFVQYVNFYRIITHRSNSCCNLFFIRLVEITSFVRYNLDNTLYLYELCSLHSRCKFKNSYRTLIPARRSVKFERNRSLEQLFSSVLR